jgi:hypothetical protein
MRRSVYEEIERGRIAARQATLEAERKERELTRLRCEHAALRVSFALIRLQHVLARKYRPDQPRVPAGNPDGGQWTSGNDSSDGLGGQRTGGDDAVDVDVTGSTGDTRVAQNERQPSGRVNLLEEEARGGHTIKGHVGKSDSYLIRELREQQLEANARGQRGDGLRVGSFTSLEAANRLVSATLANNPGAIENVTRGGHLFATAGAKFDSITGREAYARTERSEPQIRETYGVKVVLFRDPLSSKGYRVHTAYPANIEE